jgi:DNA-binding XRE family transcriptional regulator
MTGLELDVWINKNGLSQTEAAKILGVSRQTLLNERNRGSESVSRSIMMSAYEYNVVRAKNDMAVSSINLNNALNLLLFESSGGRR